MSQQTLSISLIVVDLDDGGIQTVNLKLARALQAMGHKVEFVLCNKVGIHLTSVPSGIGIFGLRRAPTYKARVAAFWAAKDSFKELLRPILLARTPPTMLRFLPALAQHLKKTQPDLIISSATHLNLTTALAKRLSNVNSVHLAVEHNTYSRVALRESARKRWRWRYLLPLLEKVYAHADRIVAVSEGVAEDLSTLMNLDGGKLVTIYNPVISEEFEIKQRERIDHPWLTRPNLPVIIAMGRFNDEHKNFSLLIRAFKLLRSNRTAKLIIIGEGKDRPLYESLAEKLNLSEDVQFPGFIPNPLPYLRHSDCFVLSSSHEGLPTVLIEALACGCPVVSTDCPSGPREILDHGRYGRLVPVNCDRALAAAIADTLDSAPDRALLSARGMEYSADKAARSYLQAAGF